LAKSRSLWDLKVVRSGSGLLLLAEKRKGFAAWMGNWEETILSSGNSMEGARGDQTQQQPLTER